MDNEKEEEEDVGENCQNKGWGVAIDNDWCVPFSARVDEIWVDIAVRSFVGSVSADS